MPIVTLDVLATRARIAEAGRAAVGLGSTGPQERQDRYAQWLFPAAGDAKTRAQMADAMYSCGLNALACLRASGVDAPELAEPYSTHIGAALAWLASIAQRMGAYVPLSRAADVNARVTADGVGLDVGDVLVVDAPVHVIVLTDKADGWTFTTSEGGAPEVTGREHGMGIKSRTMRLRVNAGRLQTGTVAADGSVAWGRYALYAIDAGKLRRVDE